MVLCRCLLPLTFWRPSAGSVSFFRLQIFGRLSGSSAVGSALLSPYESAATAAREIIEAEKLQNEEGGRKMWSVEGWMELQQPSPLLRRPARAGERTRKKTLQPWEHLFLRPQGTGEKPFETAHVQTQGLSFKEFRERIQCLSFAWPTTMNTGQAPLNIRVVPGEPEHCFPIQ